METGLEAFAEHLAKEIVEFFLAHVLTREGTEMTPAQFLDYLQAQIARHGTQKRAAEVWGISETHLLNIRLNKRRPGPRLLRQLGLEQVVTYRVTEAWQVVDIRSRPGLRDS